MQTRKRVFVDVDIHRAGVRDKLPPRNEPYWKPLVPRGYVGLRKAGSAPSTWTWIARWRKDDGTVQPRSLTRHDGANNYEDAKAAAEHWFSQCRNGVTKTGTVREVVELYIADQAKEKGEKAAFYARRILGPHVLDRPIANKRVDTVRHKDIKAWRDSLPEFRTKAQTKGIRAEKAVNRSGNSANRILRTFKAALNHAKTEKLVASDDAWCDIKPLKGADGQREIYLRKL